MTHQATDVYRYLIFLQKYLLGDLELLEKLSLNAEQKEKQLKKLASNRGCLGFIKLFSQKTKDRLNTPTIETTHYPYSFEFIYGATIISRSTIPHTATLFSTIDILGYLIRTGNDFTSTTKNFKAFFGRYGIQIDPTELSVLTKVYRHGMTHNYFPKLHMEISYHSSNPVGSIFFKNMRGDLVLNINELQKIVTTELDKIINDTSLYNNMDMQFNYMTQEYENDCRQDIDNLKARL